MSFNLKKDHIQKARSEQKRLRQEIDLLRRETENLQQQISQTQDQLPEKGIFRHMYFCVD